MLKKILEEIEEEIQIKKAFWESLEKHPYNDLEQSLWIAGMRNAKEIIQKHMNDSKDINVSSERLIDANALDEEIMNFFLTITGDPTQLSVVRECKKSFRRMIDEQPILCVKDNWIPCSERLPERTAGEMIQGKVFSVTKVRENRRWTSVERYDFESMTWGGKEKVIAWMPLPEPYKAKED